MGPEVAAGGSNVYTFGLAAICWASWKCRNKTCFDKKKLKSLIEIIIHSCSYITYWAGLYNEDFQGRVLEGVQVLLACAHQVMARSSSPPSWLAILPNEYDQDHEDLRGSG